MAEEAISIFISYSHHDLAMLTELNKHLAGLRRTNKITTWNDRDIGAGDEWEPTIQHQLNAADIIILLISADFIASDYCYCNELQRAIERHDAGEARVIPVILRPCLWNDSDIPFSKLNVLPENTLAITKWEDSAEAYTNVAKGISSEVISLRNRKPEHCETARKSSHQLNEVKVSANEFPSEIVLVEDSVTYQKKKESFHRIEVLSFWNILSFLNQKIAHQIQILIDPIQEHCRQKIQNQHSRIRLLNSAEIGVDQLYVDVWLLKKPESDYFNTPESLLTCFDLENDRLALSKRIKRNPGFEIANNKLRLVILGKPGSGKTTFLKHLAVDWCKGKYQPDKIAVLIELRRIREQTWNLVGAISQELKLEEKAILVLLDGGKLLVLLDGLDEIPTDELRHKVESQIEKISNKYPYENRFILTCRTQVMGAVPSSFSSVEVADFNSEQIKKFVLNWFMTNGHPEVEAIQQWDLMRLAISSQPDLREVTATPVLLSLICVVWQDSGSIPTNRANLYKRGISWLLRRWNDKKKIKGWELGTESYRKLSIKDKESLLTDIAARKFENPKNFVLFEQDELVEQISQKLRLANAQEGLTVLKAIEAQHGLLIERADELWSFSHLTFQEYFTVQWLTQLPSQQLAEKIANLQWQEAVEQLVKSQQPADRLIRLIRQAIDQLIAQEPAIQTFLDWLVQKSSSFQSNYKSVAIRALYYSLPLDLERALALSRAYDLSLDLDRALPRARALDRALDLSLDLDLSRALDLDFDRALKHSLELDCSLDLDRTLTLTLTLALALSLDLERTLALDLDHAFSFFLSLALSLARSFSRSLDLDFMSRLRQLKKELPRSTRSDEIRRWWPLHGAQWSEQLREVMIEYRNIGHDWQFTQEQKQQLQRYYKANNFLAALMQIRGAVSEECRSEIEEGLLLPRAELQRRQPHLYEALQD